VLFRSKRARTSGSYNLNANAELLNYWNVRANTSYSPRRMSRSHTRGGPMMAVPASTRLSFDIDSDERKALSFGSNVEVNDDRVGEGGGYQVRGNIRLRPSAGLELSLHPRFESSRTGDQYVATAALGDYQPTFGDRYLFGDLERRTFAMEARVNRTFTPDLSLQVFAQPLLSSGDYVGYKQLERSESYAFTDLRPGVGQ